MDTPNWDDLSGQPPQNADAPQPSVQDPSQDQPQEQVEAQNPSPEQPQWDQLSAEPPNGSPPEWDALQTQDEHYSTPEQQIGTAIEGAAEGLIGPIAPLVETQLLGISPKDITARQEANPLIHGLSEAGTFAGSLLLGTGEASAFSHISDAVSSAANASKYGSRLLGWAVEGGLFTASDEASKAVLGQGDPQDPVSSALLHVAGGALLGAAGGAAIEGVAGPLLAKVGSSEMGTKAAQWLSDFGSALKFNQENPDVVGATAEQMNNLIGANEFIKDYLYGSGQMKSQAIKFLTKDVTQDQLNQHVSQVSQMILDAPEELQNDPAFKNFVGQWKNSITPQVDPITLKTIGNAPAAADIFQASNTLKQQIQGLGKFGYQGSLQSVVSQQAQRFSGALADTLEDPSVWNKAGDFQKQLNAAVSDFMPKNKDFLKRFTENFSSSPAEDEASKIIRGNAVKTYLNQTGDIAGQNKRLFVQRWVEGSENLQQQVNAIHENFGLGAPVQPPPTNLIKRSYGTVSPGQQFADSWYHTGSHRAAHYVLGSVLGGEYGYREGGVGGAVKGAIMGGLAEAFLPSIGAALGRTIRDSSTPFLIRCLSGGAPEAIGSVLGYAGAVAKGASKLSEGIDALFRSGGTQAIDEYASEKDKQKIDDFVSNGEMNREIQIQQQVPPQPNQATQYFAEGGEVKSQFSQPLPDQPAQPVLRNLKGISDAMPEHAALFAAAKSRVNSYLNSVRPQKGAPKLAFDNEPSTTAKERSYQKALDLAACPIGILNHMKAGTLTPELLGHFKSMWPEIHSHISKEITGKITEAQLNGEKPPYRTRQSMSLFLGAPLDGTFTPQAIQAIQAMYAGSTQQTPPPGVPPKRQKKNTSKLGEIPKDHYTQDQAATQRTTSWN